MQAAYYGRPICMQPKDFDVRRLQLDDFDHPSEQAEIYIEYTRLATILGDMLEIQSPDQHGLSSIERVRIYTGTMRGTEDESVKLIQ